MQPRQLKHGYSGTLGVITLFEEQPTLKGQLLIEIEFLSKHACPNTCVILSLQGKERVHILRQLFPQCTFYLFNNNNNEEYDPLYFGIHDRYCVDITYAFVNQCRAVCNRILLICDGESQARQAELHCFIQPYRSLLQLNAPYPTGMYLQGTLILPVWCRSCLASLVYLECTGNCTYQLYNDDLLQQELCAFQLLTRGVMSSDYDCKVQKQILIMYMDRFCPQPSYDFLARLERLMEGVVD